MNAEQPIGLIITGVIVLGLIGLTTAYFINIEGDLRDDMVTGTAGCNSTSTASCGHDWNATNSAMEGQAQITEKTPTVANILIAVAIITLLLGGFGAFIYNKIR